jgi:exopolysaccharide biosynthesis protein
MVEQDNSSGGVSLPELAETLKTLGAVEAINLDGGSSSSFWHKETGAVYGKKQQDGNPVKRPVLSVLSVEPVEK